MTKFLAASAILLGLTSCQFNVFDPLDAPTSDAQLQSAARACFDRGDFACTAELYTKLAASSGNCATDGSTAACADVANSEQAFAILDQNGAGMGAFAAAFGSGSNASALNQLVRTMYSGIGTTKRHAIYTAYQKVALITNPSLKNLTKFLTATALAAEILGEGADTDGVLRKTSLVTSATCSSSNCSNITAGAPCTSPNSRIASSSTADIDTAEPTATIPTYDMVNSAIAKALSGLQNIGVSGGFSSASSAFSALGGTSPSQTALLSSCYRASLLEQGAGE